MSPLLKMYVLQALSRENVHWDEICPTAGFSAAQGGATKVA